MENVQTQLAPQKKGGATKVIVAAILIVACLAVITVYFVQKNKGDTQEQVDNVENEIKSLAITMQSGDEIQSKEYLKKQYGHGAELLTSFNSFASKQSATIKNFKNESSKMNDLMSPNSYKDQAALDASKKLVREIEASSKKFFDDSQANVDKFLADVKNMKSLSNSDSSEIASTFAEKVTETKSEIKPLNAQIIKDFDGILDLLSNNIGAYKVKGNQLLFEEDNASNQFNNYMKDIQSTSQKEVEFQNKAMSNLK